MTRKQINPQSGAFTGQLTQFLQQVKEKGRGPPYIRSDLNKQISSVDFFMYSKLYVAYCCLDIKIM